MAILFLGCARRWDVFCSGDLELSMENYQKALLIKPDSVDALFNIGLIYESRGQKSEARASYEKVLSLKPDHKNAGTRLIQLRL